LGVGLRVALDEAHDALDVLRLELRLEKRTDQLPERILRTPGLVLEAHRLLYHSVEGSRTF